MRRAGGWCAALTFALLVAGCGGDDEPSASPSSTVTAASPSTPASTPSPAATRTPRPTPTEPADPGEALRRELLGMLRRDQGERTGGATSNETDTDRTERLKEILDEYGWPGWDLVGKRAETAAWAIAQHSDLDPAFQAEALELLRTEVKAGNASPGNLAYLEDRVLVGQGRPQVYGTQIGCTGKGPKPATPIADRAHVEQRRKQAGLDPLSTYFEEMTRICAGG